MKKTTCAVTGMAALALLVGIAVTHCRTPQVRGEAPSAKRVLRHVVLFKFKEGLPEEQIRESVNVLRELPKKIDVIQDLEFGTDVSVENRSEGYTHCFLVTFRDEAARDAYLPHPAHKRAADLVLPRIDKVLVFDYWSTR